MGERIFIENARIVDGTGEAPYVGSVLMEEDRIAWVGNGPAPEGCLRVDGSGKLLTPGFVDVHTHSDISVIFSGRARGHILQGVTSEVMGNCGFSPFPLREDGEFIAKRRSSLSFIDIPEVDWSWRTWPEYRKKLLENGLSGNCRVLVGYGSIRAFVMGYDNRRPTPDESREILKLLDEMLGQGIAGLSVGLGYAPDFYADTDELAQAAVVVQKHGKIFTYHIRGERLTLFKAAREVVEIALRTGVKTEISHLKCAGRHNMGRMAELLRLVEDGIARGGDITFDLYPYEAGSSYLGLVFPPKYHTGGINKLLESLRDPDILPRILHDMEYGYEGWSTFIGEQEGRNLRLTEAADRSLIGKTLAELGEEWKLTPYEAAVRVMVENQGIVEMVMFQCSRADVDLAAVHPRGMFGSDGLTLDPVYANVRPMPHPRYYGTFPTVLERYCRSGAVPVETMVRKMTMLPAERFGLERRGAIKPGYYADLCLFDLEEVRCPASYEKPNALAEGMTHVWVNGRFAVKNGAATGETSGRLL